LSGSGEVPDASKIVQANTKHSWGNMAQVKWLEYGLADWTEKVLALQASAGSGGKIDLDQFLRWTRNRASNTLELDTLYEFMIKPYVGQACNRL